SGEDADRYAQRFAFQPEASEQLRRKYIVARSRGATHPKADRARDHRFLRYGFQHMRDYCARHDMGELDLERSIPDRRDRVDVQMAEGDQVWIRYSTSGTHKAAFCGLPPTGKRLGVPVVSLMKFTGGAWKETWSLADELGMMLQLGAPNLLLAD